jgi:hypothetical protein
MKKTFDLYVMNFDGELQLDSRHKTIEEAQETSSNLGSKWFFYPWCFVSVNKTIKEFYGMFCNTKTGEPTMNRILQGKRIKTAQKMFLSLSKGTEGYTAEEFESKFIDKHLQVNR